MFPASRWPFYCLHLLGKIHRLLHCQLQIIIFYCDEHLSHIFFSFLKLDLHMNQKISAMNVCSPEGFSTAHRHEHLKWISSLKLDALFLGCWSKKEKKRKGTISSRRALLQAILFFYWKCSVWMFCARVKWHFNTTECPYFIFFLNKAYNFKTGCYSSFMSLVFILIQSLTDTSAQLWVLAVL